MITCEHCKKEFHGWWTSALFAGWMYRVVQNVQMWFCPSCRKAIEEMEKNDA